MKLILFDFDGVLVDTLGICFSINVKREPDLSLENYKSFFEGNINDAIKGGWKKYIPNFDEQYGEMIRELKVPPELKEIIKKLAIDNILTIVSSTTSSFIKGILERESILNDFKDILGNDVHTSKIEKINTLLKKYDMTPGDSIFITDTVGDVKEARTCGVESICVSWGFHEKERLEKANPFKIVDTPAELLEAIEGVL